MNNIICSHKIPAEIEDNLIKLNLTPVKLQGFKNFGEINPMAYHPDMFCFNLGKNRWIFYDEIYEANRNIIDKLNLDIIIEKSPQSCGYPHDVGLNAAMFGGNLICRVKYTNEKILEYAREYGKNIIDVKQGYAKCSVCIVDENSVITSDVSIYNKICKKAPQNNINALLITPGHIDLPGCGYGFIGGCSGLIKSDGKNLLAFTGDINLHPDREKIKDFCRGRGVEPVSLSGEKLRDYGSLFAV